MPLPAGIDDVSTEVYTWYGTPGDTHHDHRPTTTLGKYDSLDPLVVRTQIAQLGVLGVTLARMSDWDDHARSTEAIGLWLATVPESPHPDLKLACMSERFQDDTPPDAWAMLSYLVRRRPFFRHPSYKRVNGRAVVYFYMPPNNPAKVDALYRAGQAYTVLFGEELDLRPNWYTTMNSDPHRADFTWWGYDATTRLNTTLVNEGFAMVSCGYRNPKTGKVKLARDYRAVGAAVREAVRLLRAGPPGRRELGLLSYNELMEESHWQPEIGSEGFHHFWAIWDALRAMAAAQLEAA